MRRLQSILLAGVLGLAGAALAQSAPAVQDSQIQADVTKALDKKQFAGVQAVVADGVVKLTGTVPTYADKEDADRRAHHRRNVRAVENDLQVAAGEVDDATLQRKLVEKISNDRVGYGTTAFNSISVDVHHGVVTLAGVAYGPPDKDAALSDAANTPGVRDVVDNINVAPLSPNDDRIRLAVFRAVYGFSSLNKYAIDPAKPIRITVVNGNVTLTGLVDTQADKDAANIRANGVSGVFKVTNELQVQAARTNR